MNPKHLPSLVCGLLIGTALLFMPACNAGQLTASEIEPLVQVVVDDLDAYLDAGIRPDGSEMPPGEVFQKRGGTVILRNAVRAALGEELLPLPALELPTTEGPPEEDDDKPAAGGDGG